MDINSLNTETLASINTHNFKGVAGHEDFTLPNADKHHGTLLFKKNKIKNLKKGGGAAVQVPFFLLAYSQTSNLVSYSKLEKRLLFCITAAH